MAWKNLLTQVDFSLKEITVHVMHGLFVFSLFFSLTVHSADPLLQEMWFSVTLAEVSHSGSGSQTVQTWFHHGISHLCYIA